MKIIKYITLTLRIWQLRLYFLFYLDLDMEFDAENNRKWAELLDLEWERRGL